MEKGQVKVLIDPRLSLVFGSYYIKGLWENFGKESVKFSNKPFEGLDLISDPNSFYQFVALKIYQGDREIKVVIDYCDKLIVDHGGYEWCDIYGKVNLNMSKSGQQYLEKSVALGPMIGLSIWNIPTTYFLCLRNYCRGKRHMNVSFRSYLGGYNWQIRRPRISVYNPGVAEDRYIYFDSKLWPQEDDATETNEWRAAFMRACKQTDVKFVGGFFGYKRHAEYDKYKDVLLTNRIPTREWLRQMKKSALVFNTPSTHGGHGWKLCEFLVLGKAIISSPILNELPVPLVHGKNVHFVSSKEELTNAINRVASDEPYRKKLEEGARQYYLDYLAPSIMIRRLLDEKISLSKS